MWHSVLSTRYTFSMALCFRFFSCAQYAVRLENVHLMNHQKLSQIGMLRCMLKSD